MRAARVFSYITMLHLTNASLYAHTIEEALSTLTDNHPKVRSAIKSVASSRYELDKAKANFLPTVNVASDFGPQTIDNPSTRSSGTSKDWKRSKQSTKLTVTQNLFQGFRHSSQSRTARLSKSLSESSLNKTSQEIMMLGISAFIDVLRQARLVDLASQNEETIQIQLNLEDERVQTGSGIAVDLLQAKSRLQQAKERRLRFQGDLSNAVTRYTQVFNSVPDINKIIEPMPYADLIPNNLQTAIDIALKENPQVLEKDQEIALTRERKRSAQSELFPKIDLVSSFNYEKHNNGTTGTRRDASFLVQANWSLFSGLTSKANIAQASFNHSASQDDYELAVRKVIENTRIAWQNLKTARERLQQLENAVNIASEVFDSRKKLRAAGKDTVISVLDAKTEITNARINLTNASFDERKAIYALMQAMGRLVQDQISNRLQGAGDTLPR